MQTNFTLLRHLLVAGLCALFIAACTPQERAPLPTPTATLSVAAARTWYQVTYAPAKTTGMSAAQGDSAATWALDWARAIPVAGTQPLVLVPLAGDTRRFAGRRVQGRRYLVVAQAAGATAPVGQLIELLLQPNAAPLDTAALFASLYHGYDAGTPTTPAQGTGVVLFYSVDYHYQTGRSFTNGVFQPGTVRLAFQARNSTAAAAKQGSTAALPQAPPTSGYDSSICTDWYQVFSDGSRIYLTTTGDCYETMPTVGDGGYGGSGGGGTYGGDGTGDSGNGGWGGSGHGNGNTPRSPAAENLAETTQLPPCASQIVLVIKNDGIKLSTALAPFFGSNLKFYPKLDVGAIADRNGKRVAGQTERDGNNFDPVYNLPIYLITINSGTLYGDGHGPGATKIGLATTVLHELTHAYVIEWNNGAPIDPNASLGTLLEDYTKRKQPDEARQHALMSNIVGTLGNALYAYCTAAGIATTSAYCTNLMWSGLTTTDAYLKLTQAEKNEIANAMTRENYSTAINNGRDADGNTISLNPMSSKACP